jgi:hypothetical protein
MSDELPRTSLGFTTSITIVNSAAIGANYQCRKMKTRIRDFSAWQQQARDSARRTIIPGPSPPRTFQPTSPQTNDNNRSPAAIDALFHFLHSRSLLSCTTSHLPFCTYQFLYDFRALIIHLGETRLISRIALVHFTIHRLEPAALIPVGAAIGPRATNHERVDRAKWTA